MHDRFYSSMAGTYEKLAGDFGEKAKERILKTLSVTEEYPDKQKRNKGQANIIKRIKGLIESRHGKEKTAARPLKSEYDVCMQKLAELRKCMTENHELTIGIRPERVRLEKKTEGKDYRDSLIVTPTVCELLGGEYNVHFTFCGKNMIGRIDAKEKITVRDEMAVSFSADDIYIFDPVTGEVIR